MAYQRNFFGIARDKLKEAIFSSEEPVKKAIRNKSYISEAGGGEDAKAHYEKMQRISKFHSTKSETPRDAATGELIEEGPEEVKEDLIDATTGEGDPGNGIDGVKEGAEKKSPTVKVDGADANELKANYNNIEMGVKSVMDAGLNKKQAKDLVNQYDKATGTGMDEKSKEEAADNLTKPSAMDAMMKRIQGRLDAIDKKKGARAKHSDLFSMALLGAIPTLIGGLLEGAEGTAMGAEVGLASIDKMESNKQKEIAAEAKEEKFLMEQAVELGKFQQTEANKLEAARLKGVSDREKFKLQLARFGLDKDDYLLRKAGELRRIEDLDLKKKTTFLGFAKEWRNQATVKADLDGMSKSADMLKLLADKDIKLTTDFLAAFVARSVQKESGPLAEEDVKRAKLPAALHERMMRYVKEGVTGEMTDSDREAMKKLLIKSNKTALSRLTKSAKAYASNPVRQVLGSGQDADLLVSASLDDILAAADIKDDTENKAARLDRLREKWKKRGWTRRRQQ